MGGFRLGPYLVSLSVVPGPPPCTGGMPRGREWRGVLPVVAPGCPVWPLVEKMQ